MPGNISAQTVQLHYQGLCGLLWSQILLTVCHLMQKYMRGKGAWCFYCVQFGLKYDYWLAADDGVYCWNLVNWPLQQLPDCANGSLEGKLISWLAYSKERKKSLISLRLSGVHPSFFHRIVMDMYFQGLYHQPVPFIHFVEFIMKCVQGWKWHTCCSECSFSDVSCLW